MNFRRRNNSKWQKHYEGYLATIGQIDPLYAERPAAYRSIIIGGLNKMVYRIDNDVIYIVDFWDTRREPKSQAAQTE